jgi:hypothetical protein
MTDLDTTLTNALNRRALGPSPSAPPATAIAERARRQSRRRTTRTTAAAVGASLLVAGAFAIPTLVGQQPNVTPTASQPAAEAPRDPSATVPGWTQTNRIQRGDYAEFQFENRDQRLQVSYYPGDFIAQRLSTDQGSPSTPITLRGTTGFVPLNYPMPDHTYLPGEMDGVAPGLTRIVWLEGEWTIEASGIGIPTSEDLASLLETLQPYAS